ncbi:CD1108 family mobile element protein [Beduinella massiliensis]|uniref:CD1108 family mobile element protein n=1 Tax=Beduinella massiliensis TaxID=1852363 RepID=UPI000C81CA10
MNKTTNEAGETSGQAGQKFRQESTQERLNKSKLRMEKRGGKLEAAREKLANQKPPKRPGPVKRVGRAAGRGVHGYVHGKLFQVEQDNVGTEGAHRSEMVGETALRGGARFVKKRARTHPARAAAHAESSYLKAQADYQTRKLAQEHPEAMKNALSRQWYKHKLKKQYQKKAREAAKQGTKAAGKTTAATGRAVAGFVRRHPVGALILVACFLLLLIMQSCMSQMVSLGNATVGAVAASTYSAEDGDLLGAEAAYAALEEELRDYLDSYESTHSYDEYHYDLDEIEHDPYNLLSILCALHEGAWTVDEVRDTLQMLFDRQYILTENVVVETRYYTDTRTDSEGNEYDVEVPYDYYICYVSLENFNLSKLPIYIMGEEQLSRYALFMATLGNRPDLFPGSDYVGKYVTNPPPDYEVPEEYLADERFAAILAEAEKYIGYPYVWGGYSPSTSFDCSGFVSWVINHSGWDVGRLGATSLYNICTPVSTPRPGDLVFFVGTYDTAGCSHCGIYVGDGIMLHCGDPIQYSNLNSSYWQAHFYAYGRLP